MIAAAVEFYDVIVWLHITAVVVGFGPPFAFGLYLAFGGRNEPRTIPVLLDVQSQISRTLITIGALIVLATGIYLAADRWEFSDFFIAWGIIAILVVLGVTHGFLMRNEHRAAELARRDIDAAKGDRVEFGGDFWAIVRRNQRVGPIMGLIIILTIYVMATKPFM